MSRRPSRAVFRRRPPRPTAATRLLAAVAGFALAAGMSVAGAVAAAPNASAAPTAAAASAVVLDGNARFEVLTPTLVRLEYAGDGVFQDGTTFNAVNRSFSVPSYTTDVSSDGYREIRTSGLTLRYKQGSGPFTAANLSVTLTGTGVTAQPAFPSFCPYGSSCEAENGQFSGQAATAYDHTGHTGSGFVAGYQGTGSGVTQDVASVPAAGTYRLWVRYSNAAGGTGSLSTRVGGAAGPALSLAPTAGWNDWAVTSVTVSLKAGSNSLALVQNAGDTGKVNIDSIGVTALSATTYPPAATGLNTTGYGAGPASQLGGWSRSLDNPAALPVPEHPGILDRDGWYLMDDTRSALLNASHTVTDRPSHGSQPYEDGYFFGYGQDYKQALADLNALTGPTALLPESAYGVWYSRYYPYSTSDYENTLLPAFRDNFTPVDWLVVDTDWKSPSTWNGWNWNSSLFPDPQAFLNWTRQQGLSVSMNIHTSIQGDDPKFAAANSQAGGLTREGTGNTYDFDWSKPAQLAAYLSLHQPFEQQGVREWWLDYCTGCGASTASDPQVAPDNLINQAYADEAAARGLRGFSFARVGGSQQGSDDGTYALGPWSERRNSLQFTGDTPATWDMLAFEARFTPDEAAAGLSHVSDDIGSFHGNHLADDLYARWMQLGAFQPVDRMHSDHGDRLPWNYTGAAASSAASFLRLREALVPYTYTLARQANTSGVPIVRPLYLNYPAQAAAYTNPGEYLYGDNVLVAPITSPNDANGNGSVSVWFPPGSWTDYFTGRTYTGPTTATVTDPLSQMPVFLKAGGILPTRTDYTDNQGQSPLTRLTVNVPAGADGSFTLYQDAGEGTGYLNGQSTSAPLTWNDAARTLTVGAQTGTWSGAPSARAYTLRLSNSDAPTAVSVDGVQLPETAWAWNANRRTVTVTTASLPLSSAHTVTLSGSATANPVTGETVGVGGLCLDVRGGLTADGTPVQLYGCNHTAAQQVVHQSDGTVRILGKCLTVNGNSTADHAPVGIATCAGLGSQTWTHRADGTLVNTASGRCLDVPDGNTTPGAVQVQIYGCDGNAAQLWQLPPGQLAGPGGLCADVADADPASATPVQLWSCNATDAQRWSAPGDGTVRVFGKCLDVAHGATANGTSVQLWDCNGSAAQNWASRADGTLFNPASGRCLDDPDDRQTAGDQLQIYDCNTTAAQRYTLT
ncbi:ricin-type beta-trefoil lectin domain protein [Actinacidiphila acidipaludis]|uniref:Ricin-type beta-trefoil lectin domain protein n=1 Tax=Actinacidiphila acidipaludis TaxID=2873382 RepID=A0ABS7QI33_9ACTN|nr:ricin-type beta-trefoil lectin domain protein [Streptomyces acidipaludis]MBY8882836.1 ricin-type beta-trefoil lectin domain protein [Streptomyces acidipaludis]